jgi:hypothetical protein
MRKIEQEMLDAIAEGEGWSKGNTAVFCNEITGLIKVYLHGHHIASRRVRETGGRVWSINYDTLRDWPTRTTMSRLRALGFDVCTRKGVVYHAGQAI